ncbi:EF-P 5-aminopentanol modification-associated protein YfmH [Lactovum miscens]|uniref:Putative Zn-dependent peptidase n=1 Tax=Lactovum miscens TaxID=190387 RepID=A0A841C4Q0_9LACT|nr:pitrilysin family protein [Lactovum miscens]MBB5887395.1 putative Zn-dependent peptidase [Lactovum miscens]
MITEKYYKNIDETLYTEVFKNGLTVYYLPNSQISKAYGIFSTNFGSLDITFADKTYPAGIAHFLEHKLFEKEEGDVMLKFGSQGAQTNAFTSFDRTSYLFSGTENIKENIELLIDFVQTPYFTEASVAKEQGIITQEIQMYQDDPDWRLYAGLLAALYPKSPLAEDIAGTPESIGQITVEMLYKNYETFYQPSNMCLFLTGAFDVLEISELLHENQDLKNLPVQKIDREEMIFAPSQSFSEISMDVSDNKLGVGLRGNNGVSSADYLEYRLSMQIFFAMIFGKTSKFYENAYKTGLIDDSFNYEFESSSRFRCFVATLDTKEPEKLAKILQDELKKYKINADTSEEKFDLIRRQMLGDHIASLNSQEHIANEFTAMTESSRKTFFDSSEVLSQLTLEKVLKLAESFLDNSECSVFLIRPKK